MTIIDPPIKDKSDFYKTISSRSKNSNELPLFDDESDLVVIVAEEDMEGGYHSRDAKKQVEYYSIKVCVKKKNCVDELRS